MNHLVREIVFENVISSVRSEPPSWILALRRGYLTCAFVTYLCWTQKTKNSVELHLIT